MTQMSAQVFFVVSSVKNVVTVPVAALREGRTTDDDAEEAPGAVIPASMTAAATPPRSAPPPSAPVADGHAGKSYEVRVLRPDGHRERRQIQVGLMNRVSAQVLSGLKSGEVVIVGRRDADANAPDGGYRSGRPDGGLGRGL
jgi:macrolide-specific efflux system membrane fusion protein